MSHLPHTLLGRKRPAEPKCSNSCNSVRDLWGTIDETIVFLHFPSPSHFAGQLGISSPISVHAQSRCNCCIILFRFRNKHPPQTNKRILRFLSLLPAFYVPHRPEVHLLQLPYTTTIYSLLFYSFKHHPIFQPPHFSLGNNTV